MRVHVVLMRCLSLVLALARPCAADLRSWLSPAPEVVVVTEPPLPFYAFVALCVFAFAGARPPEKRPLAAEGAAFFGGAFFFGATRFFGAARAPPVNMLTSVTRATAAGDDGSRLAAWRAAVAARAEVRYSIVICGANETHVG